MGWSNLSVIEEMCTKEREKKEVENPKTRVIVCELRIVCQRENKRKKKEKSHDGENLVRAQQWMSIMGRRPIMI